MSIALPKTMSFPIRTTQAQANRAFDNLRQSMEIIAAARAAGTHSDVCHHVCGVCRQWAESIFHIGFDGTRMCPGCADLVGAGPQSIHQQARRSS